MFSPPRCTCGNQPGKPPSMRSASPSMARKAASVRGGAGAGTGASGSMGRRNSCASFTYTEAIRTTEGRARQSHCARQSGRRIHRPSPSNSSRPRENSKGKEPERWVMRARTPAGGVPDPGAASIAVLIFSVSQPCTDSLRRAAMVATRATAHSSTHRPSTQPARRSHMRRGPRPRPEVLLWPGCPALGEALPPRAADAEEEEDGGAALCS